MQDITIYSDSELSLLFNNTEGLYNNYMRAVRRNNFSMAKELADDIFIYTPEQLAYLEDSFLSDVAEYEAD